MKKSKLILLLLIIITLKYEIGHTQCTEFVTSKGFDVLDTGQFVPEGRFDAMTLSQGDYLKVYKSFFRGKSYKVVVIADDVIPDLKFQVKSMQGDVIYDNSNATDPQTWEYTSDKNQNLIIKVELPPTPGTVPKSGCVAVILGYKF